MLELIYDCYKNQNKGHFPQSVKMIKNDVSKLKCKEREIYFSQ